MIEPVVSPLLSTWILALAVPLTILATVLSALFGRSGPIRLRHWAEEAGGGLRALNDQPARFEALRFLLSLLAKLMPLVTVGALWVFLASRSIPGSWWISLVAVAGLLLIVEWVARDLVEMHAEQALEALTGVMRFVFLLTKPVVWILSGMITVSETSVEEEEDEASEKEIDAFIDVGRREGILEPKEEVLVRSIVDFGDSQVKSVMTPRVEICSVASDASLSELTDTFFESKHARLPVRGDTVDQIVGILHLRDLFEAVQTGREVDARQLANAPYYVPESKPLPDLLAEMQKQQQQMAIVVDEYGGVAGLATVEDLLEEIVGEIADEHEEPERSSMQLNEHSWRLLGRVSLEELDEMFDLDLDLDDLPYETVSGLICGELGYVPKAGEELEVHDLSFKIDEADERRVVTVTASRQVAEPLEA